MRKFQEAHDQYLEAIKIDPKHENTYNNLINLYFMTKQYKRAMDYVNKAEADGVAINPKLKKAILEAIEKQK